MYRSIPVQQFWFGSGESVEEKAIKSDSLDADPEHPEGGSVDAEGKWFKCRRELEVALSLTLAHMVEDERTDNRITW